MVYQLERHKSSQTRGGHMWYLPQITISLSHNSNSSGTSIQAFSIPQYAQFSSGAIFEF